MPVQLLSLLFATALTVAPTLTAPPIVGLTPEDLHDTFDQTRGQGRHEAIDIMEPRGTPVHAVVDGTIAKLFLSKPGGNTIYLFDDAGEFCYYYAHLDRYADGLHEGMSVERGQILGYVGTSGNAAPGAPQLHLAILRLGPDKRWWQGMPIDPYLVLLSFLEKSSGKGAHAAETAGPDNFHHRHLTGLGFEGRLGVLVLGVILIGGGLYQKGLAYGRMHLLWHREARRRFARANSAACEEAARRSGWLDQLAALLARELGSSSRKFRTAFRLTTIATIGAGLVDICHVNNQLGTYIVWLLVGAGPYCSRSSLLMSFSGPTVSCSWGVGRRRPK